MAGISVALVLIPQSLAYAGLAGMPAQHGLYAAALPPIAAALFASSPYLQTGPVAITSLLALGALTPLAAEGSAEYVGLALLLAVVVGIARVAIGVLRLGVVAYLMSQPMLTGFVPAAAILIVASQLPTALGVEDAGDGVLSGAASALAHPDDWEPASIVLSAVVIALVSAGPRLNRLVPAVLIAVVAGIAYRELAGYDGPVVGAIPEGLPALSVDLPWESFGELLLPGIVIAVVGFAEPASIARTFAALERKPWEANREFVSQGAANLISGFSGGFPVGGSFSRSALNRISGARTRLSGAVTGVVVLCFLPFASVLSSLPRAVLAAIVIGAVSGLVRLGPLVRLRRYSWPQLVIATATFALTLALAPHIELAVVIGIGLSVAVHLLRELSLDVESRLEQDALHLHPRGVLWFGNAQILEDAFVQTLADHPQAASLVVHLDGLGRIDLSGALALRRLLDDARAAGLQISVVDVPPRAQRVVSRVILG